MTTPAIAHAPLPDSPRARIERAAQEHEGALMSIALRLCRSRQDAQDLVQDTFERALRCAETLERPAQMRAWLCAILRNHLIDQCRRALRRPLIADDDPDQVPAAEPEAPPLWSSVTAAELQSAVSSLEPEFRAVYALHALEGRSYDEVAAALGIPKATVGTRLLRARRKLRALLAKRAGQEDRP